MKYYVAFTFLLIAIKKLLDIFITDTPENLKTIMARHRHIIDRTINKPKESNANSKSGFPMQLQPHQIALITEAKRPNQTATKGLPDNKSAKGTLNFKEAVNLPPAFSVKKEIGYNPNDFKAD